MYEETIYGVQSNNAGPNYDFAFYVDTDEDAGPWISIRVTNDEGEYVDAVIDSLAQAQELYDKVVGAVAEFRRRVHDTNS